MSWFEAIRVGAGIALLAPILLFTAKYLMAGGTWDELPLMLATGALNSVLDLIEYALTSPAKAVVFVAICWLAGRLAFGR